METDLTIFFIFGTVLIAALAITLVLILVVTTRRQIRDRLEKQKMQLKFEEDLLHARIEVQEQALRNVSGEIHDGIGQELSLARLQLRKIRSLMPQNEGLQLLDNHSAALKNVIKNLRLLSHSLNTQVILTKGLETAIESEMQRIQMSGTLQCHFETLGEHRELSAEKELLLFRIFQESTQNVLKHAKAHSIFVVLSYLPHAIEMQVTDNGKGFHYDSTAPLNQSLGLGNMAYRASMLRGTLNIYSAPGAGTRIRVYAPYS